MRTCIKPVGANTGATVTAIAMWSTAFTTAITTTATPTTSSRASDGTATTTISKRAAVTATTTTSIITATITTTEAVTRLRDDRQFAGGAQRGRYPDYGGVGAVVVLLGDGAAVAHSGPL